MNSEKGLPHEPPMAKGESLIIYGDTREIEVSTMKVQAQRPWCTNPAANCQCPRCELCGFRDTVAELRKERIRNGELSSRIQVIKGEKKRIYYLRISEAGI